MKKLKEEKKMIDFEVKKLEFMDLPKLESDFNNSGFVLTLFDPVVTVNDLLWLQSC